jgi:hypothetical protein
MKNEFNHFGIPAANLRAAKEAARRKNGSNLHSRVPSRREVATLETSEITAVLIGWMCHSPIEIIPSRAQIAEVKLVLLQRSDAAQLSDLMNKCDHYIRGD